MIIKGSGEKGHLCLVPHLNRRTGRVSIHCGRCRFFFFTDVHYEIEEVPFYSRFTGNFYHRWVFYLSSKYVIK